MIDRPDDLPEFANEPLYEVALGVQFSRLERFRQGHFGRYWSLISDEYPRTVDRERIDSPVENLGSAPRRPSISFEVIESAPTDRAWFVSDDETRLVQLQDDRLLVNWRRGAADYPRFGAIRKEFEARFGQFHELVTKDAIGPLNPLQVEVGYVNRIEDSAPVDFLRSSGDPGLSGRGYKTVEQFMVSRHLVLDATGNAVASLTVEVRPIPPAADHSANIAYQLGLTYRQPLISGQPLTSEPSSNEVSTALEAARRTIVRSFTDLTSDTMHTRWERTK